MTLHGVQANSFASEDAPPRSAVFGAAVIVVWLPHTTQAQERTPCRGVKLHSIAYFLYIHRTYITPINLHLNDRPILQVVRGPKKSAPSHGIVSAKEVCRRGGGFSPFAWSTHPHQPQRRFLIERPTLHDRRDPLSSWPSSFRPELAVILQAVIERKTNFGRASSVRNSTRSGRDHTFILGSRT